MFRVVYKSKIFLSLNILDKFFYKIVFKNIIGKY